MDNTSANPMIVILFCVARCFVPLLILLGISYLLRRFGFIKAPPSPPIENNAMGEKNPLGEGGLTHENQA